MKLKSKKNITKKDIVNLIKEIDKQLSYKHKKKNR
ncbi:hypothetical protein EDD68_12435 [Melghiribacillus thermohalophilus]|uniref:Uncharacterized protein n=1 Tax=Melghiribacillus thermohalophilus TaxID=1324956 RepID=A0A4R3MRY4_9BACI|nr:hypothetical protein EDD68_12435 [Melghiribacillus thermohalophilus]